MKLKYINISIYISLYSIIAALLLIGLNLNIKTTHLNQKTNLLKKQNKKKQEEITKLSHNIRLKKNLKALEKQAQIHNLHPPKKIIFLDTFKKNNKDED